tara:strand:+ start:70 stop:870 length:801 start_codon:yes stop_codon:yes gene_type:complete
MTELEKAKSRLDKLTKFNLMGPYEAYLKKNVRKEKHNNKWVDVDISKPKNSAGMHPKFNRQDALNHSYKKLTGSITPLQDYQYQQKLARLNKLKKQSDLSIPNMKKDALWVFRRSLSPKTSTEGKRQIDFAREERIAALEEEIKTQVKGTRYYTPPIEEATEQKNQITNEVDSNEAVSNEAVSNYSNVGADTSYIKANSQRVNNIAKDEEVPKESKKELNIPAKKSTNDLTISSTHIKEGPFPGGTSTKRWALMTKPERQAAKRYG